MRLFFTLASILLAITNCYSQNVGIGTTTPQGILDVRSNTSGSYFLENPSASSTNTFTVKIARGNFTPSSFAGLTPAAIGVLSTGFAGYFKSSDDVGLYAATMGASYAVWGVSDAPLSRGVFGSGGSGTGVFGASESGEGLWGSSRTGNSLYAAKELATTGHVALFHNRNGSNGANAVEVISEGGGHGLKITKTATTGDGLNIAIKSDGASGIYALNTSTAGGFGIVGESNSGASINGRKNGFATGPAALFENNYAGNSAATVEVTSNSPTDGIKVVKNNFGNGIRVFNNANVVPSSPLYANSGLTATSGSGNALFVSTSNTGIVGANLNSLGGYGIYAKNYGTVGAALFAEHSGAGAGIALELSNGYIKVSGANKTAFIHTVAIGTTSNVTVLSYPGAEVTDMIMVTPNYNPSGVDGIYNAHPIGVYWTSGTWAIFNQDLAAMPVGASFNVLVIKQF